jgi:hypothetical protein
MGSPLNPFGYGNPVPPEQFIGRESVIRTLFERINNSESTAVVGGYRIGKTSLLRYIASEQVRSRWLGQMATQDIFVEIDSQSLSVNDRPIDFWERVLTRLEEHTASQQEGSLPQEDLITLFHFLEERFNESELRTLCFYLGIGYDDLPGQNKTDKAREVVEHFKRRDDIAKLVKTGKQQRHDINWDSIEKPEWLLRRQMDVVRMNSFGSFTLERLFTMLAQQGQRVVLLIDEFDTLLEHPNFSTAEFFGALRSIATRNNGLALVTASHLEVADMNRRGQEIIPVGSPFFNFFIEVRIPPLQPAEVNQVLDQALDQTSVRFDLHDRRYIRWMSGCHPYLAQAAAAVLFDAVVAGKTGEECYTAASEALRQRTGAHFDGVWRYLKTSPVSQTALVMLTLAELSGQVDNADFNADSLGRMDWFIPELRRLADRGFVEHDSEAAAPAGRGNGVIWQGQRWRISAMSFVWWIADNAFLNMQQIFSYEQWLDEQVAGGVLTHAQKERLKELIENIPPDTGSSVNKFVHMLLQQ